MPILILLILAALAAWLSPSTFRAAYERAESRDIAYHNAHPDCTWEEAHRHRERVRRWFLRP